MKLILEVAAAWLALSIVVGLAFGKFASAGRGTHHN